MDHKLEKNKKPFYPHFFHMGDLEISPASLGDKYFLGKSSFPHFEDLRISSASLGNQNIPGKSSFSHFEDLRISPVSIIELPPKKDEWRYGGTGGSTHMSDCYRHSATFKVWR